MEDKVITKHKDQDEIDLTKIFKELWTNRIFIIKISIFFTIIGLLVAIFTPNIYTSSCTLIPQTGQRSSNGNLGGLAAIAGINLGSITSSETLSPSVYPRIFSNVNLKKELIYSKVHIQSENHPITLYDYYTSKKYQKFNLVNTLKKYTIDLPRNVLNYFRTQPTTITSSDSSDILSLTKDEKKVIDILSKKLLLSINNKEGYITLTASLPEPIASAELTQIGQKLLQKYLTAFRIEKVASNLVFVDKNYIESKINFEQKQSELAKFRDSNKGIISATAKTQEEKLISEYNLLFGIYTELAKQKEQAKIAITETTPILTIIEPVVVPLEKNAPNRPSIIVSYFIFGLLISSLIILIIAYLNNNFANNILTKPVIKNIYNTSKTN